MKEYRYTGMSTNGQFVRGVVVAGSNREARAACHKLTQEHRFALRTLQPKRLFTYRVQRSGEKVLRGVQAAFSRDELQRAFDRAGYRVLAITRKLIPYQAKPSSGDVVTFIRLSADLIRESLPYDEVLNMLQTEMSSASMRRVIREVRRDLHEGLDGRKAFRKQEDAIGRFPAYMLGIATGSGNMAEVYESTAKFMERNLEFRKALRSALIMPAITCLALLATVLFYVGYIFPKTAEMFLRMKIALPPLTKATLALSQWLQANIYWLLLGLALSVISVLPLWFSNRGREWRDRWLLKIPMFGSLMQKTSIEIFCRVFYCLYSGSGDNMECIRVAAEACRNRFIERRIKEISIPMMLREGKGLIPALRSADVFTENCLTRLRSGAETGTLRQAALQVATFYERETTYRLKSIIDWIQVLIALVITLVLTALTIVSSETALVKPTNPTMKGPR